MATSGAPLEGLSGSLVRGFDVKCGLEKDFSGKMVCFGAELDPRLPLGAAQSLSDGKPFAYRALNLVKNLFNPSLLFIS